MTRRTTMRFFGIGCLAAFLLAIAGVAALRAQFLDAHRQSQIQTAFFRFFEENKLSTSQGTIELPIKVSGPDAELLAAEVNGLGYVKVAFVKYVDAQGTIYIVFDPKTLDVITKWRDGRARADDP